MSIKYILNYIVLFECIISGQLAISAVGEIQGNRYFVELVSPTDINDLNTYSLGINAQVPSIFISSNNLQALSYFYVMNKVVMSAFLGKAVEEESETFSLSSGSVKVYLFKDNQLVDAYGSDETTGWNYRKGFAKRKSLENAPLIDFISSEWDVVINALTHPNDNSKCNTPFRTEMLEAPEETVITTTEEITTMVIPTTSTTASPTTSTTDNPTSSSTTDNLTTSPYITNPTTLPTTEKTTAHSSSVNPMTSSTTENPTSSYTTDDFTTSPSITSNPTTPPTTDNPTSFSSADNLTTSPSIPNPTIDNSIISSTTDNPVTRSSTGNSTTTLANSKEDPKESISTQESSSFKSTITDHSTTQKLLTTDSYSSSQTSVTPKSIESTLSVEQSSTKRKFSTTKESLPVTSSTADIKLTTDNELLRKQLDMIVQSYVGISQEETKPSEAKGGPAIFTIWLLFLVAEFGVFLLMDLKTIISQIKQLKHNIFS
ncbi:DgyrCDS3007 [Dimorphilus gyrociliatus]|uniref:DgyrCDS3007 n=1 Tax=Dimorphilus gyrociliatus TaxID=2664684 RepID=A0A7I8VCH7_9ANNE|nr:DgyrCDS3007 [Dimorphilus gyrociliatus]